MQEINVTGSLKEWKCTSNWIFFHCCP